MPRPQRNSVVSRPIVIVSARSSSFIVLLGYATTLMVAPALSLSSESPRNSIRDGGAMTTVQSFLSRSTLLRGGLLLWLISLLTPLSFCCLVRSYVVQSCCVP